MADEVKEIMARIGENELLYQGVRNGVLPLNGFGENLIGVNMWSDEGRLLVVELSGEPRRLVLDELLGWQWYNSEGPEE
jgi:hypothetical protein